MQAVHNVFVCGFVLTISFILLPISKRPTPKMIGVVSATMKRLFICFVSLQSVGVFGRPCSCYTLWFELYAKSFEIEIGVDFHYSYISCTYHKMSKEVVSLVRARLRLRLAYVHQFSVLNVFSTVTASNLWELMSFPWVSSVQSCRRQNVVFTWRFTSRQVLVPLWMQSWQGLI